MGRIVYAASRGHKGFYLSSVSLCFLELFDQLIRAVIAHGLIRRGGDEEACLVLLHLIYREHLLHISSNAAVKSLGVNIFASGQRGGTLIGQLCGLK